MAERDPIIIAGGGPVAMVLALALHGGKTDFDVRFSHTVTGLAQHADSVAVAVQLPDGTAETVRGSWAVGCDGGRSTVRKAAGIDFVGFTYPEKFIKIGTYFDYMEQDGRIAYRNQSVSAFV